MPPEGAAPGELFQGTGVSAPDRSGSSRRGVGFFQASAEIRQLVEEVTGVSWGHPSWAGFILLLAASEALSRRGQSSRAAVEAFITALQANSAPVADTFMVCDAPAPPVGMAQRAALAALRARAGAETLWEQDAIAPDQRLLKRLVLRDGWFASEALPRSPACVTVAFLVRGTTWLGDVRPVAVCSEAEAGAQDRELARALLLALRGDDIASSALRPLSRVAPHSTAATAAAVAVALEPVDLQRVRSFHREAWTAHGGPWLGIADAPPYLAVSTCHVAVDGYVHARVSSAVTQRCAAGRERLSELTRDLTSELGTEDATAATPTPAHRIGDLDRSQAFGWAAQRIPGATPRFAHALHSFARVLDERFGEPAATRSVPFHVPVAPGDKEARERWRGRPLYGLLALEKTAGRLETSEALARRLPGLLSRESEGRGLLTRVLRAMLDLPVPRSLVRRLISQRPGPDSWFAPAQVLTGSGYLSWMRFPPGELPSQAFYPSAIPSFGTDGLGGAGLSIAHYEGGIAAGLTTTGSIGTDEAASRFLRDWAAGLTRADPPLQPDGDPGQGLGVVRTGDGNDFVEL